MKRNLLLIAAVLIAASAFSQKNYWKVISERSALSVTNSKSLFSPTFQPKEYRLFSLDEAALQNELHKAALRSITPADKSNVIISIPVANGSLHQFRVAEAPVMEPLLAARYSNIRSYVGQDVRDASLRVYFDFTAKGFHAVILSPKQSTVYVNPVASGKGVYFVFDRSNQPDKNKTFDCKLAETLNSNVQGNATALSQSNANLRTYRFAVASGGEFSQLCLTGNETNDSAKKASVLSVLVTDLVRTNAIFETDFGVHLNYVAKEDTIIFLNGATDPFQSSSTGYITGKWNTQAQQTNDKYIGSANYDVGHLLMGYPTGGNAGCIGCVCISGNKGSGATGFTDDLTTDPFVVDFWDHEIGHQFGGNHTFDYSFEGTIAQMEPGSGSTIMGYAGTTGANDIQPHSDPYFHAVSIQQIDAYITAGKGNTCGVKTATGNIVPLANAGSDYTIPKSTPFALTGASSGDVNDTLTYCWEQYDVFVKKTSYKYPEDTSTTGPVFRSLTPVLSNQRTFPALESILDGTNRNTWEVLPSVARTLNFRLTVRDNHTGGGSTSNDDMVVTVDKTSGPFTVTTGNSVVTVRGGSKVNVTWNVANTNKAPVNCSNVKILLSTDGGETFSTVLLASTANSGSAKVTIPNVATTNARIKIQAIGNIFFDVNDTDFTIKATTGKEDEMLTTGVKSLASVETKSTVQPNPARNFTTVFFNADYSNCSLLLSNGNGKAVYAKSLPSVSKGAKETISLANLSKGVYFLQIVTEQGTQKEKIVIE